MHVGILYRSVPCNSASNVIKSQASKSLGKSTCSCQEDIFYTVYYSLPCGPKKTDPLVYFDDNFGKYEPI